MDYKCLVNAPTMHYTKDLHGKCKHKTLIKESLRVLKKQFTGGSLASQV